MDMNEHPTAQHRAWYLTRYGHGYMGVIHPDGTIEDQTNMRRVPSEAEIIGQILEAETVARHEQNDLWIEAITKSKTFLDKLKDIVISIKYGIDENGKPYVTFEEKKS